MRLQEIISGKALHLPSFFHVEIFDPSSLYRRL